MSKYILNKTPLRTSNNYKINDIEIDLDINKKYDYNDFNIISNNINDIEINKKIDNNFTSKIGLNFDSFYKLSINIKDNIIINEPIIIDKNIIDEMFINEININIGNNSNVNFIIKYSSDLDCINSLKQVLNINDNSKCNISIINLLNDNSKSFISIECTAYENSTTNYNFIDLGGNIKISNYYGILNGKNSVINLNNVYVGVNNDRIDMNYYIASNNEKVISNINVQGVLNDNSIKSFKGTIDFLENSKKSIGREHENCILLSNTCKSKSLPMLLCHEEDVEGEHSVSTGKIDNNKLFYLMSRGINENEAIKLIINANFDEIINNINNTDIQNEIRNVIDKKLN